MVSSDHYDPPAGLSRSVADLGHRHRSAAAQPQGGTVDNCDWRKREQQKRL